jgi:beta-lactam-binding protein with PASTA domain/tRNA A-37 threonylcarbamoyl transferase component Bud32
VAELGAVLGDRYRLEQVLGQGGMATIFRATDSKLDREVAVKVLRPEFGTDAAFVERFRHEAQAAASLNHPNIVQVYDFGADPAGPYIVMEQVAGGDLSIVLNERGALPPTAVARVGQQVADALTAAHAAGLVHRDIKPSNILLSPDGRVQVADFGIAQAAASASVTATGITLGSVLYFSPEQARGDTATAASDIYSLGLVMYELLTGQRAFSGDSPAAVAVARLSGSVPSPMAVRAEVPPALDAIVRWCLATDSAARPGAAELSAALSRFIADPSGAAAYATAAAAGPTAMGVTHGTAGPAPGAPPTQTALVDGGPTPSDLERSGSGPWTWMAAGLGLLVIIASGILLFLLFSGIGDEAPVPSPSPSPTLQMVQTPDFVGRLEGPSERFATNQGLVLEKDYVETDDVEAGRIIEQLPAPGVEIAVGTSVQVTVATQIETVVVPDVSGIIEAKAREQLKAAGLVPGERFSAEEQLPEGYVISTDPRAGVSMTRGAVVDYLVSTGPIGGGTPGPTKPPPAESPTPVPTLDPPSPSPFPSGELTLVGDFLCLDLATARRQLEEAGLLIGATIPLEPPPGDHWIIHDQLPKSGESVPVGSAIDLVLVEPLEPCPAG